MDYDFLIRIYRHLEGGREEVKVGTAYPVAPGRILTARHVLADGRDVIEPTRLEITWFYHKRDNSRFRSHPTSIRVIWDGLKNGGETGEWDAVILECEFPPALNITSTILSKRVPAADEKWLSRGFPAIGMRNDDLEPTDLLGKTCGCHKADRKFQVIAQGKGKDAEGWCGASGAPIFVHGSIFGLVTDACKLTEGARIDAIPIFRLLEIPSFRQAVRFDYASIDPLRFKTKISKILEGAPQALKLLEVTACHKKFHGKQISIMNEEEPTLYRALRIVDNMFLNFDFGKFLLEHALHECSSLNDAVLEESIMKVAYLFFPACFARDESDLILYEYKCGTDLIDAKAASMASIELRMAAIEGRAAEYDPDQTREDGPVGRKKIHDPPPFALEAMRSKEFSESFAKFLFEKTFSKNRYKIEEYFSFTKQINKQIELGKHPEGAPYIILGDFGDKHNSGLTDTEAKEIAKELRTQYSNLMVTSVSENIDIIDRELEYLDWFWKRFKKN